MSPWFSMLTIDLRAFLDLEGRAGDRAVVGQHPHGGVAEPLGDRRDAQVELVAVGQLDQLGRPRLGKAGDVGREVVCSCAHVVLLCRRAAGASGSACAGLKALICCAMYSASSLTQPSSADPLRVLPGQPEEVQPGRLRHAAPVHERGRPRRTPGRRSTSGRRGSRSPRSRLPTSSFVPSLKLTVDPAASTARPWSSTPCRRRSARGLEPISVSRPSIRRPIRDAVVLRISPVGVEVPEQVAAEDALRQRRLARSDRQVDLARARQLLGDLEAGVAAADHEHRPFGRVARASGTRCCGAAPPPGRDARRSPARTGPGTGPVATTTWSASYAAVVELDQVGRAVVLRIERTRLSSSTGRSKWRA